MSPMITLTEAAPALSERPHVRVRAMHVSVVKCWPAFANGERDPGVFHTWVGMSNGSHHVVTEPIDIVLEKLERAL